MVADQHRVADRHVGPQTAGCIRQHDISTAGSGRHAHAVHDGLDTAALVEVSPAQKGEHALVAERDRPDPDGMPLDGRRQEARQVSDGGFEVRSTECVHRGNPT